MPTIDQLPDALAASDADEILVSQGGVARKMTRAQLLAGVQPSLTMGSGQILAGPSTGTGAPQPVTVGSNLIVANGTLSAAGSTYSIAGLPPGNTPIASNLVGVSENGTDVSVTYAMFMSGIAGLSGINLSAQSVVPTGSTSAQTLANFAANTLPRSGGQVTGPLLLASDPTQPSQAATKRYADQRVLRTGDTMTGVLTLAADPTRPLQAATKEYVDSQPSAPFLAHGGSTQASAAARFGRWLNVVDDFGADPTGATNSTPAFQAALAALNPANTYGPAFDLNPPYIGTSGGAGGWLFVPPGYYQLSHIPQRHCARIVGAGRNASYICHTDPTQTLWDGGLWTTFEHIYVDVANKNYASPISGPPTLSGVQYVRDCTIADAWIAAGSNAASSSTQNILFVDGLEGYAHSRLVYLNNIADFCFLRRLKSQAPLGIGFQTGNYGYTNRYLVEVASDVDGVLGDDWFLYGGKGLFTQSGSGNLLVDVTRAGAEAVTAGIWLQPGSSNDHEVRFRQGYPQTNDRTDGVFLTCNQSTGQFTIGDFFLGNTDNDFVQEFGGVTRVSGCTLFGSGGASVGVHVKSGGKPRFPNRS